MFITMKAALFFAVSVTAFQYAVAEDITFTNRIATFTNLQGQLFRLVQLARGDQDGLIWRDGASGGRICYTNLHPALLEYFGISTNRIEIARDRAEKKALADARYRAQLFAGAQAGQHVTSATNETDTAVTWPQGSVATTVANGLTYNPNNLMYPVTFQNGFIPFDPTLGSAPSAASAPSAGSALNAGSAPRASSSPTSGPASSAPSAPVLPPAFSAPSAPSAPPSLPVRRR